MHGLTGYHLSTIINGMSYTIGMDAAGRLVLPKAVRERYGLLPGAHELEATDTPDGIILRPKVEAAPLIRSESGWMVFQSDKGEVMDPVAAVEATRLERFRVVAGED